MNEKYLFDFGTGGTGRPEGVPMDTDKSNDSSSPSSSTAQEAATHIEAVRSKRGRSAKDSASALAERERIRNELSQEFAALFDPQYWEGIVRGPADLMLVATKREIWNIPERELKPLAMGASHTVRLFLRTDPKWIALLMFSVSLTQVYGGRMALHIAEMRKEARERKDKLDRDRPSVSAIK